jgi:hypothetical protein
MVVVGHLEELLKVIGRLSCLVLEVPFNGGNDLLVEIIGLLVIVTLVAAGCNCDLLGSPLWLLLLPLALLFTPLLAALGDAPRLP